MQYRRNILSMLLLIVGLITGSISCSKDDIRSLSELKNDQSDAIKRLISERGLRVVELSQASLPDIIDPGVYYRMPNGLYLRVLDQGTQGTKMIQGQTRVFVMLKGFEFTKTSIPYLQFDNLTRPNLPPIEYRYAEYYSAGDVNFTLTQYTSPQVNYDSFMNQGIAYPLSLRDASVNTSVSESLAQQGGHISRLGNGARLSLIIPFELGPSGTYSQGISMFVEEAEYTIQ